MPCRAVGPVAVAMLDIDHFKRFNDTNGHPAGDRLLREAASRWRAEMRGGDFLARLGGEEFALLVTGADVTTIADNRRAPVCADAGTADLLGRDLPAVCRGHARAARSPRRRSPLRGQDRWPQPRDLH